MATPNKMALVDRLFDALAGREGCIINDTSWAVVVVYETKVEGDEVLVDVGEGSQGD